MQKTIPYRIIIPIFNEEKYIRKLLDTFPEKHRSSIILIDDGSSDNTKKIIQNEYPFITYIRHDVNLGKGKSMETGAKKAMRDQSDILIFMDGDLQHKPSDIDRFLEVFQQRPEVEIVFGARKIGTNMKLVPFLGNKHLTIVTNLLFRYFLNDTQCGFRAIRSHAFEKLQWKSHGYSVETEMIIHAAKHKLQYKEIPIDTIYLDHYKGTGILDGIIITLKLLFWKIIT